jgi:hypothetical protein
MNKNVSFLKKFRQAIEHGSLRSRTARCNTNIFSGNRGTFISFLAIYSVDLKVLTLFTFYMIWDPKFFLKMTPILEKFMLGIDCAHSRSVKTLQ